MKKLPTSETSPSTRLGVTENRRPGSAATGVSEVRHGGQKHRVLFSLLGGPLGRIKTASPVFGLAVVVSLAGRPEPRGFGYCWAALMINDLIPGLLTSV